MIQRILGFLGRLIAYYLNKRSFSYAPTSVYSSEQLFQVLKPGDVILVEGDTRVSTAIKYLTQSTWSHAALFIGDRLGQKIFNNESLNLIEADIEKGVIAVPLSKYCSYHIRVCRPVGLTDIDCKKVVEYAVSRLGNTYDLKNVVDLARYLFPTPPVPVKWRRSLIAFGSGEPTKAICSTLVAQAFQSVRYPILPRISYEKDENSKVKEILHIRHHSLFAPRDFDLSPYFQIVKPALTGNFKYKELNWDHSLTTEGE